MHELTEKNNLQERLKSECHQFHPSLINASHIFHLSWILHLGFLFDAKTPILKAVDILEAPFGG